MLVISNRLSDIYSNGHLKRLDVLSKSHLSDEISLVASEQPDCILDSEITALGWGEGGESGSAGHRLAELVEAIGERSPGLS